jgi:signal transduction histidine kinase
MLSRFRFPAQGSFREQLTAVLTAGILVLALSTSLIISGVISQRLEAWLVDYLMHLSRQLSINNVFAFLAEDTAVAKQRINNMLAFPGVRYVALLKRDYSLFIAEGGPVNWTPADHVDTGREGPTLVREDSRYWHIVAPVQPQPLTTPYEETGAAPERLGYLHIAWDITLLKRVKLFITAVNFTVSLGIAVLLITWLRRRINRLTSPLSELATVMQQAQSGAAGVRAVIAGPQETREIGQIFNALMAQLERHRASLESEVTIRTLELREARDAALAAVRHKSAFLAAVTHEMRTPLHAITGYTQLALEELPFCEDDAETGPVRDYLGNVLTSAQELLLRINQVLDLARLEAGKVAVRLHGIDLKRLLKQLMATITPLAERNGNTLEVVFEGNSGLIMDGDKLSQIILNLLTNACKFTHHGIIHLQVLSQAGFLVVEVTDSGIGIAQEQLDLIFEPFRQVDMSDQRHYEGTGLGLAITKSFCDLLGGHIAVKSQVGSGSCFRVTLPLPVQHRFSDGLLSLEHQSVDAG